MAHCINVRNPEYINLVKQSSLGQRELKARIATWQELNKTDSYPSIEQVEGLLESSTLQIPFEEFKEDKYLRDILPHIDNLSLKESLAMIKLNDKKNDLSSIKNDLNTLYQGSSSQRGYTDSFINIFDSLLTEEGKNKIYSQYKSFKLLSDMYNEYIDTPDGYTNFTSEVNNLFNRMLDMNEALNEAGSLIQSYIKQSIDERGKFNNDLKVYDDIERRIPVPHKGKNTSQVEASIKHAVGVLQRSFSDKVEVKVSTPKKSKSGIVTYVYVEKPVISNYQIASNYEYSSENIEQMNKNKEFYFGDSNESTAKDLLDKIIKSNKNTTLASTIMKFLPDNLKIIATDNIALTGYNFESHNVKSAAGIYDPATNTVILAKSGINANVIIHEIIHGITYHQIRDNPDSQITKDFKSIFDKLKKEDILKDLYPMENLNEFITGIFTDTNFINQLKQIEPLEGIGKYKNIFQELFDKILQFLGIKSDNSIYNQAFSIASNIINDNYQYITSLKNFLEGNSLSEEYYKSLNDDFTIAASPTSITNTPYTQALKRLNANYNLQDLKELSSTVAQEFTNLVSWYHEGNKELTREEVINWITPQRLFQELREQLEDDLHNWSSKNTPTAKFYSQNIQKLLNNFNDMALMSTTEINFIEGLKFGKDDLKTFEYDLKEELDNGTSQSSDMNNEVEFHENSVLDGWMRNFKHSSVSESLTNIIKRAFSDIDTPSGKYDKEGNSIPVLNSIGYPKKMSLDVIKNDLLKYMQKMITSKDMLPALGIMAKEKPYIKGIIKEIENDSELASQFYSVFKKDFTKHSIVTTNKNSDGTLGYKTVVVNQSGNQSLWMENWRNNLENKVVYDTDYSVYNTNNTLNLKNIENNIQILQELIKEWNSIIKQNDVELRKDFISRKSVTLENQLKAIGIDLSDIDVKGLVQDALVDTKELKELFGVSKSSFHIDSILNKLVLMNTWAKNNINKEGITALSLIQENNSNYATIARLAADSLEELIEGSVHENGKSYYTYLQPSYLSKITKQLKNVRGNSKEFNEFIQKEFGQYLGTIANNDGSFNISWLNDLTDKRTGASKRELFDHKTVLNFNKTDYDSLSPADYQNMLLVEYFSNSNTAWYHVPVLAEAPSAEFIKFDKITLNFKDNVSDKLLSLFTYEYNRIKTVRARQEGIKNGNIKAIKNFDTLGNQFQFMKFLNEHLDRIDFMMSSNYEGSSSDVFNFVQDIIKQNLDIKAAKSIDYLNETGLLEKTKDGRYKYLHNLGINDSNFQNKLEEYFYNSYLATSNIIQLTSTDLSYYKNVEDFQKRNKEIHAPGTMVNTQATYKGERIGKDRESYIILADYEQESSKAVLEGIKKILDNNTLLSQSEKDSILDKYSNNNVTDAQAYRSLDSARSVIAMSTGWNDRLENSYQRLKKGQWDIKDYNNIMQAFKPFVYTQSTIDSGILADPNDESKGNMMIKVPTQHKNSEAILLPVLGMQFDSPKLRGIMQAMSENNLDAVMFESAVKVGLQGVININDMNDRQQIVNHIKSFRNDNQVFKSISYEDYKIQQSIPEHLQDAAQLYGTQLRKLVISDIDSNAVFSIRGKEFNKNELVSLYNNLVIENTIQSYQGLLEDFGSIDKLQDIIENELINNSRYSKDLLNACQKDNKGRFILPLFDPSQSNRIQQLLNSVWKSRVTKQKIKGGKAVQMSSYGLSDSLELKINQDTGAIEYMEAYIPFWSNNMPNNLDNFIDKNTGIMDVNKMLNSGIIDEEFLEAVSYRIPTEDKYSIWPIKVKGFLPRNAGGNIILPREITTITGSD